MVCEEVLPYHDADLAVDGKLTVNLMLPATEATFKRLRDAWWDVKLRGEPRLSCWVLN